MKHAAASWAKRRPYLALAALAFALRAGCAVVTEIKPLFPPYYYTDAVISHERALHALAELGAGRAPTIAGTLNERLQTIATMAVYRVFGARPLAIKLVNAALGALSVALLAYAFSLVFQEKAAWGAGLLVALWPSHIFYTSQNLRESPTHLFLFSGLAAALGLGLHCPTDKRRRIFLFCGTVFGSLGAGFYRSYVLPPFCASLLLAFCLQAARTRARSGLFAAMTAVSMAAALYPYASNHLLAAFVERTHKIAPAWYEIAFDHSPMLPATSNPKNGDAVYRPTSPEGISNFRRARQASDRQWARIEKGREIGTQIFPDATFQTWGDVAAYLPKGAFYVLFMPLPGLYPMDGKLGRYAAGGENVVLLALFILAAIGFARGPKTPARLGLLTFCTVMAIGAALLEFDLGSAGRHKLLYLPILFPFAAEEILQLRGRKESP